MNIQIYRFMVWMLSTAVVLASLLLPAAGAAHAAPLAGPSLEPASAPAAVPSVDLSTPTTDPIPVTNEIHSDWLIDNSLLYWELSCPGGEFIGPAFLRRKPLNGGNRRTIKSASAEDCIFFRSMVADETGIYYYNTRAYEGIDSGIHHIPAGQNNGPAQLIFRINQNNINVRPKNQVHMALDSTHIYWITQPADSSQPRISRIRKDGSGGGQTVAAVHNGANDLLVVGSAVYWIDDLGLWGTSTSCDSLPCEREKIVNTEGNHLVYRSGGISGQSHLYWVENGQRIRRRSCSITITPLTTSIVPPRGVADSNAESNNDVSAAGINGMDATYGADAVEQNCSVSTIYTAPTDNPWQIGRPAVTSTHVFFRESHFTIGKGDDVRLRRLQLGQTNAVDIAVNLNFGNTKVDYHNGYVYFYSNGLKKLPWDVPPIVRDLAARGFEVTQGIQSLDNDVPLVADKETYVRGYGQHINGPYASAVNARLHGIRNGNPLPDSPLNSISGSIKLETGKGLDRLDDKESWLFKLPNSWTQDGSVTFRLEVDPAGTYDDPSKSNNSISRTLNFQAKAPICMVTVPVRTHAPKATVDLASFWPMVHLAEQMLPTEHINVWNQNDDIAETQVCWWGLFPYPCFGPYELPSDNWKVMASLWTRDLFTDDPDVCDDAGAVTHYVGLIHPSTGGDFAGLGDLPGSNLMLRMPPLDDVPLHWRDWSPNEQRGELATTLAHELGHNYNRKHVDCDGPKDPDVNYPYNPCRLDDGALDAPGTHYVWDVKQLAPIAPNDASDLMSYRRPRFISDYTWKAIFNRIEDNVVAAQINPADMGALRSNEIQATDAMSDFAQANNVVLVTGGYTPTNVVESGGQIDYAYVFAKSEASEGQLRKWQRATMQAFAAGGHDTHVYDTAQQDDTVVFRLLDANGAMLVEQPATILSVEDDDNEQIAVVASIPEPQADVATVQLVVNGTVLAGRTPGATMPTISLTQPAAGETVDETLTVSWMASDADESDRLLYIVQYSYDNGGHWRTVSTDIAGPGSQDGENVLPVMVQFNASDLPGSNGQNALVRVLASDGYHTAGATSQPFTVLPRKPQPFIITPAEGARVSADQPLLLRGGASDTEDGRLAPSNLSWAVDGTTVGLGESQLVMGLAPGQHMIALTATDSDGHSSTLEHLVTIRPLEIASSSAPILDGFCDDATYANGTELTLKPYNDGSAASVQMVRVGTNLYACFHNMQRGATDPGAFAGIRIDKNNSRDALAQSDDYGFFAGEDGRIISWAGNGSGGMSEAGPTGFTAQMSAGDNAWSAELRIAANTLDDWDHLVSLSVGHYSVQNGPDNYEWPYSAESNKPDSWAEANFGTTPEIVAFSPNQSMVGSAQVTLEFSGTGFIDGATVLWNELELVTQFGSSTHISATLPAAQLANVGNGLLTVRNPGNISSGAVRFQVDAPTPVATSLGPDKVNAGSEATVIIVNGSGFANGAIVLWEGAPLVTTYVNETQITAQMTANQLAVGGTVNIAVQNPGLGGETSNVLPFAIMRQPGGQGDKQFLYLPIVLKQ